jgi:SpoVK/Ycf46/Vps4 family AAA+-type ATPase
LLAGPPGCGKTLTAEAAAEVSIDIARDFNMQLLTTSWIMPVTPIKERSEWQSKSQGCDVWMLLSKAFGNKQTLKELPFLSTASPSITTYCHSFRKSLAV